MKVSAQARVLGQELHWQLAIESQIQAKIHTLLVDHRTVLNFLGPGSKIQGIKCILLKFRPGCNVTYQQTNRSPSQSILENASEFGVSKFRLGASKHSIQ
jgi:hypothetical protein